MAARENMYFLLIRLIKEFLLIFHCKNVYLQSTYSLIIYLPANTQGIALGHCLSLAGALFPSNHFSQILFSNLLLAILYSFTHKAFIIYLYYLLLDRWND